MNENGIDAPPLSPRVFWVALLALTVLAAGIRLHDLGEPSFWADEVFTVRSTNRSVQKFDKQTLGYVPTAAALELGGVDRKSLTLTNNAHWRSMGVTETRLRLVPCLIGILTVPLLALAGRPLLGTRVVLLAALLLTVAPWHIQYSQSARFYTQSFLFYNLALLWYFLATDRDSRRYIVAREVKGVGNGANFWPYVFRDQKIRWLDIPENRLGEQEFLVDRMNREAVDFIQRNKDRPLF